MLSQPMGVLGDASDKGRNAWSDRGLKISAASLLLLLIFFTMYTHFLNALIFFLILHLSYYYCKNNIP